MMVIMFLSVAAYYVFTDLIPIYKEKQWKTFWIYSVVLILTILTAILAGADVIKPSPSVAVKKIIYSILGLQ